MHRSRATRCLPAAWVATLATLIAFASAACATGEKITLSSGPFGVPAGAMSVDRARLNAAAGPQAVTVYRAGVAPRTALVPGPVTATLAPGELFHNAKPVGGAGPFVPGFYNEVVVETASPHVLPSLHVWQDRANTVIPGTLVAAGSWVGIR